MSRPFGLLLIFAGVVAILVGAAVYFGWLSWFGNLPGDVDVRRGNTRFFFPITSMLVVSLVLTVLVNLLRRLL